jgi:hypothetical protein
LKKALIVLSLLVLSVSLSAQVRTGSIYGKVLDNENNPLPGVAVTLSANILAPLSTVTSDQGMFRFPNLQPANDYQIKAELKGFKTAIQQGLIIQIGKTVEVNLTLQMGILQEQITVVAVTPVVDSKKTVVQTNFNNQELQSLPSARDPWVIMQLAPGIMLDRENVGGNESGQQASFINKGDMGNNGYVGANNIWALDGIDIGDTAALGGSALYYDFDMFEELNISTGGADVSVQTGGIALNMVSRRGGNKAYLAGRFYLTDNYFQAEPTTLPAGVRNYNKIVQNKDYGFNAGGPIIKDKIWWWGAYGVQDLYTKTMYSTDDKTLLNNYNFKINAQLFANNRFEAMVTSGAKEKYGRNAAVSKPEGDHQIGAYHWGSPVVKIQDEQSFGANFFMAAKYSFNDAGFGWVPMVDENLQYPIVYDNTSKTYSAALYGNRSWGWYNVMRPRNNAQVNASLFNDGFLGASHEIKAGIEYSMKEQEDQGNYHDFDININYNTPQVDLTGDSVRDIPTGWRRFSFYRSGHNISNAKQIAGYLQDTLTFGRFSLVLGLRYDFQQGFSKPYNIPAVKKDIEPWQKAVDGPTMDALANLLPAVDVKKIVPDNNWKTWSPRIGLTWDITGNGKNIAKISVAQYGDVMGVGNGVTRPLGTGGSMNFWWYDANGDKKVSQSELYWMYSINSAKKYQLYPVFDGNSFLGDWTDGRQAGMYSGFDPLNPTTLNYSNVTDTYSDESKSSSRTRELLITFEKELLPDFAASVNFSLRRYDNYQWWQTYYPNTGVQVDDPSWYVEAGKIPASVGGISTGGAAGRPWYVLKDTYQASDYSYVAIGDNYNTYWGLDFVVNKRLSHRWFMNASFTFQDQRSYGGNTWLDLTNKWMTEGQPYATYGGGASGKTASAMYSKWMAKVSGMYQLPFDINVSGTLQAREGWKVPHYFWIQDDSLSGVYSTGTWVYTQNIQEDSLPTFYSLSLRIEKMVKIGDFGRLYFMADIFNALNKLTVNRAYDAYLGDYYVDQNLFVPNPTNRLLNEVLNPRVTRFGVRFQF